MIKMIFSVSVSDKKLKLDDVDLTNVTNDTDVNLLPNRSLAVIDSSVLRPKL